MSGSRTHIQMDFRSTAQDGLLMWIGDVTMRPNSDYMFLTLHAGAVVFRFLSDHTTNMDMDANVFMHIHSVV